MSATSTAPNPTAAEGRSLGYFLCWAVVFADIGTSVYYTPGILYHQVGVHAALFVCMTLVVFILLTIKYAEVTIRYPEGGGVVTVASRAIHALAGLVGGLFILVDYFLTSALSALSGVIYLSLLMPALGPVVVPVTVLAIAALGVLNLMGVKSSACRWGPGRVRIRRQSAASTAGPDAAQDRRPLPRRPPGPGGHGDGGGGGEEGRSPDRYVYLYLPDSRDPSELDWLLQTLRSGRSPTFGELAGS
jgi:hypothetical protein